MINERDSKTISNMRFPLITMVVIMHGMGFSYCITDFPNILLLDEIHTWDWYFFFKRFLYNISTIAVPVFFIISGFLFFNGGFHKGNYIKKMKRRIHSLLIPYIIWNTVMFILLYFKKGQTYSLIEIFWGNGEPWYSGTNYLGGEFVPSVSPVNFPLWYVRDLMVLCIISPLIYWLIRKTRIGIVAVFGLLYISYVWPHINFNAEGLFFFTLGGYLSIENKSIIVRNKIYTLIGSLALIFGVFLVLFNGLNSEYGIILRPYYTMIGSWFFINFFYKYDYNTPKILLDGTFAIYVLHAIIVSVVFNFSLLLFGEICMHNVLAAICIDCFLYPSMIIAICIFLFFIIRKISPKFSAILFGNR